MSADGANGEASATDASAADAAEAQSADGAPGDDVVIQTPTFFDPRGRTPDELSEEAEALAALGVVLSEEDRAEFDFTLPLDLEQPTTDADDAVAEDTEPEKAEDGRAADGAAPDEAVPESTELDDAALSGVEETAESQDEPEGEPTDTEEATGTGEATGSDEDASATEAAEAAASEDTTTFLKGLLEAILFVSDRPLELRELARVARIDKKRAGELLAMLVKETRTRGIRVEEVAGGFVFRTNPAYSANVRSFLQQRPVRLSRAQIETLAIVAYRQPITRPEIDDIRGVDSGPVLKGLLERDLIRIIGKKDEPGRPMLYGTTNAFLEAFSLKSLRDLPTLREFTELTEESRQTFEAETGEAAPEGPLRDTAEEGVPAADSASESERAGIEAERESAESEGPESEDAQQAPDSERAATPEDDDEPVSVVAERSATSSEDDEDEDEESEEDESDDEDEDDESDDDEEEDEDESDDDEDEDEDESDDDDDDESDDDDEDEESEEDDDEDEESEEDDDEDEESEEDDDEDEDDDDR